jgi:hypothetical protein
VFSPAAIRTEFAKRRKDLLDAAREVIIIHWSLET